MRFGLHKGAQHPDRQTELSKCVLLAEVWINMGLVVKLFLAEGRFADLIHSFQHVHFNETHDTKIIPYN